MSEAKHSNEWNESLGDYLRREREFRKITQADVARATRLQVAYIQSLEAEAFEELPGRTFIRGYLKAYAQHIGLSAEDVLLRYEQIAGEGGLLPEEKPVNELPKQPWKWQWRYVWMFLLSAGVIALAAYLSSR